MVGVIRLTLGVILLVLAVFFVLTLVGILLGLIFLVTGLLLIASGLSAREDSQRMEQQQRQTNYLLQQQLAVSAALAARPSPSMAPGPPTVPTSTAGADRYCPYCGQGNVRTASFCHRCGKNLPAM